MRRTVLLIAVMLVPAVSLLTFVVLSNASGSPDVNHAIENYLAGKQMAGASVRYERAAHPSALTPQDGVMTHGRSAYFRTSDAPLNDRPLPFPPNTIWCVTATAPGKELRMFVAEHQDLYNAEWLVHEPVADAAWVKVGCR